MRGFIILLLFLVSYRLHVIVSFVLVGLFFFSRRWFAIAQHDPGDSDERIKFQTDKDCVNDITNNDHQTSLIWLNDIASPRTAPKLGISTLGWHHGIQEIVNLKLAGTL